MGTVTELMLRCEATTTLVPAVALAVAEQFFSANAGLAPRRRKPQAILFEGNDGHVSVSIIRTRPTTLEIEASEWEALVSEFMDRLPR